MKSVLSLVCGLYLMACFFTGTAAAQGQTKQTGAGGACPQPIYKKKEVSRPAKVVSRAYPKNDLGLQGTVVATAVLCRTGEVTDISILFGLTDEMNKRVVEAVRQTRFVPAQKDGQPASQQTRFEYFFGTP